MPQDSSGSPVRIGDRVRWRGEVYTITAFGDRTGRFGTHTIEFDRPPHLDQTPDELSIDLIDPLDAPKETEWLSYAKTKLGRS